MIRRKPAARFHRAPDAEAMSGRGTVIDVAAESVEPRDTSGEGAVIHAQFHAIEPVEQTAIIRQVWGDAILAEPDKVRAILDTQAVIREENTTVVQAAINIGRALIDARQALTTAEFQRGLRASRVAWGGWSKANVAKLMAIAHFYDRHRLDLGSLPQGWTTLYEFTMLDEDQFSTARRLGLFRPDVRRTDIQAFKARLDRPEPPASEASPFDTEIERLNQRLKRLDSEATGVRRQRDRLYHQQDLWRKERTGQLIGEKQLVAES